jgi:hypothetical protein
VNRWASRNPEAMAEIAALPPSQQNAALRDAMRGTTKGVRVPKTLTTDVAVFPINDTEDVVVTLFEEPELLCLYWPCGDEFYVEQSHLAGWLDDLEAVAKVTSDAAVGLDGLEKSNRWSDYCARASEGTLYVAQGLADLTEPRWCDYKIPMKPLREMLARAEKGTLTSYSEWMDSRAAEEG